MDWIQDNRIVYEKQQGIECGTDDECKRLSADTRESKVQPGEVVTSTLIIDITLNNIALKNKSHHYISGINNCMAK